MSTSTIERIYSAFTIPNIATELSELEQQAIQDVLIEFSALTNAQTYFHTFGKRLMKPVPGKKHEFLGCTHRADMIPYLLPLIEALPAGSEILDVGAGAGDVVNFALKYCKSKTRLNLEEPNQHLIDQYLDKIKLMPNLELGIVHRCPIQDLYHPVKALNNKQDLILGMQMIYHLTDYTKDHIDPEQDIVDAISFMYESLAPGGSIFLSYSDLSKQGEVTPVCGLAIDFCRIYYPNKPYAENLQKIYDARNYLLDPNGCIVERLNKKYPEFQATMKSSRHPSYFYTETIAEMGALALIGELCESNDQPFNLEKLKFCIQEIIQNPNKIGLTKETRDVPQKGLWRGDEPQVITVIHKAGL